MVFRGDRRPRMALIEYGSWDQSNYCLHKKKSLLSETKLDGAYTADERPHHGTRVGEGQSELQGCVFTDSQSKDGV